MVSTSRPAEGGEFVDRIEIIRMLLNLYDNRQNAALVGIRRIGKSSICIKFCYELNERRENVVPVYFKIHENIGSPARFAIRFLIEVLQTYFRHTQEFEGDVSSLEIDVRPLTEIAKKIESEKLQDLSLFLTSYFPPKGDNEREVFKRIFKFPEEFALEKGISFAIILDEFQDIQKLERYKAFSKEGIISLFEGISSSQRNIWYCLTGSMTRMMDKILESQDSPLYGRFKRIDVKYFEEEDISLLATRIGNKAVTGDALHLLQTITLGNPYPIVVICNKAQFLSEDKEKSIIDKALIEESFYSEITEGELNSHCNYLYDSSLERASRSTSLKEVLRYIALKDCIKPSELSKALGRDLGEVSPLLRDLENVNLIGKSDGKYRLMDPILSMWLKVVYGFNEPQIMKIKGDVDKNYREQILKLKRERGFLFESHINELLRKFDNSEFGKWKLSKFDMLDKINIYDKEGIVYDKPTNVEIDVLCQGTVNWIFELEYRKRLVTKKDLDLLISRKKLVETKLNLCISQLSFVSISGFTEETLNFADKNEIWCIDLDTLNRLLKKYQMRRFDDLWESESVE